MVYAREVGGRTLTLMVSGMLWRDSLVMMDEETKTLWSQVTGEAIRGPLKGKRLQIIPAVQTTWSRWRASHPDTTVLKKEAAFRESAYEKYSSDPSRFGLGRARKVLGQLPGKAIVNGIAAGGDALAVADVRLLVGEPVFATLGHRPVVIVRGTDGGVRAFVARIDAEPLEFRAVRGGRLADGATGSVWDPERGVFTAGELAGRALEPLPVTRAFWFAWSTFYPSTRVID